MAVGTGLAAGGGVREQSSINGFGDRIERIGSGWLPAIMATGKTSGDKIRRLTD